MGKEKFIAKIVNLLGYALFMTIRVRIRDDAKFLSNNPPHPVIITFWHNRILAITKTFLKAYPKQRKGVVVLTSPSRDGRLLAEVARGFGMDAVFGSNNKRPLQAISQSADILRQGKDLAVTPDGPRGPCYHLNPGVLYLAQREKAPLMPVHAHFLSCIRLKSWDEFRIPLPFSTLEVRMAPYEWIGETENDEAFEKERRRIEKLLENEAD